MKTKSPITQYNAGSRATDCVQAYRDYHRNYQRGWDAKRREHQASAMQDAVTDALVETIERKRREIVAGLRREKCEWAT